MLTSTWLSTLAELRNADQSGLGNAASEEALLRVQGALLALGFEFASNSIDGTLNDATAQVIASFKAGRGIRPVNGQIDGPTLSRIDYELSFCEGNLTDAMTADVPLIRSDFLIGSLIDRFAGRQGLEQTLIDSLQLEEKFCLRLSFVLPATLPGAEDGAASYFSKIIAEPRIFADYCSVNGPCSPVDFFDTSFSFVPYRDFLRAHNPSASSWLNIGKKTRPDILSHRPTAKEWYEIKPQSVSGVKEALEKLLILSIGYPLRGYPYVPGTRYHPTREIHVANLVGPDGEQLEVYLDVVRPYDGLIFWALCLKGEYVRYFNRVRVVAGTLAILVALAELAGAAAAGAEAAEAARAAVATAQFLANSLRALGAALALAVPVLRPGPKPK
jgi:hypothetical protein